MDSCSKSSSLSCGHPSESSFAVEATRPSKSSTFGNGSPVLKRKRRRPRLNSLDGLFSTALRRCRSPWTDVLVLVNPETVVGCRRVGLVSIWLWRSRPLGGRPKITEEIRVLIRRLAQENRGWGARNSPLARGPHCSGIDQDRFARRTAQDSYACGRRASVDPVRKLFFVRYFVARTIQ
jgi:hypothetical protein